MLSEKEINKIKELHNLGVTNKSIAEQIGCSAATVKKYIGKQDTVSSMINERFGSLTVIERAPKRTDLVSRCIRYTCLCDCGKYIEVNGNALRSGHTTSCGCSRKGTNINDLTGKQFGELYVLELSKIENHRAYWKCRCSCGNIIEVQGHYLTQGDKKSCGCIKESFGEKKIKNILSNMNINFQTQYIFTNCKNKRVLPFDFAIFDNNELICLIEYQGDIHFTSTGGWNTEERLLEQQNRDKIKKEYCNINGIKLIEIPYTDYDKLDEDYLRKVIYGN